MIPTNLTKRKIEFYKLAKKHDISMTLNTEKLIEVNEKNRGKFNLFSKEIKKISINTKVVILTRGNERIDSKGYDITGDKSLYLIDDNYYNKLIGGLKQDLEIMKGNQLSLL